MMPKSSVKDMVTINATELFAVADKQSVRKFCTALGYSPNFINNAVERGRISATVLDKICKFYGVDKNKIIVETPPKQKQILEDTILDLLAEQNERFDAKLEEVRVKEERDVAELKRIITSLQVQIEQIKNERRLETE